MNLNSYRIRVARASGLSRTNSDDLDLIDELVNEGVVQFLRETKCYRVEDTLALTADEGDYTLASDILSIDDVWVVPAGNNQPQLLTRKDSSDIVRMRLVTATPESSVMYYALEGQNLLMLYPAPLSSSDVLHFLATPYPDVMSATADTPSTTSLGGVPGEFHQVICDYACWKACELEENRNMDFGEKYMTDWEKGVALAKVALNRRAGPMGAPATWGRPTPWQRVAGPGVDLGE